MNFKLETERLLLVPFSENDTDFIIEILNSEGWLKYIGNRNVVTKQDALNYLQPIFKSYKENSFGLCKLILKTTMQPIGMSGLIKRDNKKDIDLGFALLPNFMGYGYTTEIGKVLIEYAKNSLNLNKLVAFTLPENTASIKVLTKLGFNYAENYIENNETLALYELKFTKIN